MLYDGECCLCATTARRFAGLLAAHDFRLAPLQAPWVRARLGGDEAALLREMRLLTPEGYVFGGAEALRQIAGRIWWAWPLYILGSVPPLRALLDKAYRRLAARRNCVGGACNLGPRRRWIGWMPLAVLPAIVVLLRPALEPWVFMWTLAAALFLGCKWQTWWTHRHQLTPARSLAYWLWVGMDPQPFAKTDVKSGVILTRTEWRAALFKTILGAILLWQVTDAPIGVNNMLAGWVGMFGIILLLHFGVFHLLALFWRRRGFAVEPLMNAPLLATSLGDFWGNRWNRGFHYLAYAWIFKPLVRRHGLVPAMLMTFLASGLVHDLVISLPAGAGYGLPTLYFVAQGFGVLLERSRLGRRLGLGHGVVGWLFVFVFTAGPAFRLFHPPFVQNVILPMLQAIGATGGNP
ncbi:MAG: DCC1-like thiol-disulfide oxidoreductase family protein [Verrucomicrobiota bacterium]